MATYEHLVFTIFQDPVLTIYAKNETDFVRLTKIFKIIQNIQTPIAKCLNQTIDNFYRVTPTKYTLFMSLLNGLKKWNKTLIKQPEASVVQQIELNPNLKITNPFAIIDVSKQIIRFENFFVELNETDFLSYQNRYFITDLKFDFQMHFSVFIHWFKKVKQTIDLILSDPIFLTTALEKHCIVFTNKNKKYLLSLLP